MTYGSSAGPHALTGITGTYNGVVNPTFTYDANGNMTGGAGKTFTWTSYNTISKIVQASGSITLGFTYKPDHQRLKLCVGDVCSGSPTAVTLYLNDPVTGSGSELTTAGSTTTWNDYIVADGGIVAERTNSMSVVTMQYFTLDHMGSTVALTNSSGGIIEENSYDPYGKRRTLGGGTDTACALTSATTRGFSGHEMMDSVCLTNMNARLYDQTLGRFIGADSVTSAPGDGQDLNPYSYVDGRNATFRDPTGQFRTIDVPNGGSGQTQSTSGKSDSSDASDDSEQGEVVEVDGKRYDPQTFEDMRNINSSRGPEGLRQVSFMIERPKPSSTEAKADGVCELPDGTIVAYQESGMPGYNYVVSGPLHFSDSSSSSSSPSSLGIGAAQAVTQTGMPTLPKPGGVGSGGPSGPWTSPASSAARGLTGNARVGGLRPFTGTSSVGGSLGRVLPFVGTALMALETHDMLQQMENAPYCAPLASN